MAAGDLSRRRYFPRQRGPGATGDYGDWDVAHVVSTRPNVTRGRPVFRGERSTPLQPSSTCRLALTASGITAPEARDYSTEGSGLRHRRLGITAPKARDYSARRLMGPQPDLLTPPGKFHSETNGADCMQNEAADDVALVEAIVQRQFGALSWSPGGGPDEAAFARDFAPPQNHRAGEAAPQPEVLGGARHPPPTILCRPDHGKKSRQVDPAAEVPRSVGSPVGT
jgi:hypothetical protein